MLTTSRPSLTKLHPASVPAHRTVTIESEKKFPLSIFMRRQSLTPILFLCPPLHPCIPTETVRCGADLISFHHSNVEPQKEKRAMLQLYCFLVIASMDETGRKLLIIKVEFCAGAFIRKSIESAV